MKSFRIEADSLGQREIPAGALYGINTLRGAENFAISPRKIGDEPALVSALGSIKWAAARTNCDIGVLDSEIADAIGQACQQIVAGQHNDQFIVDMLEGSGGTSINMNANEVIANGALRVLGRATGDYGYIHPNDHVNLGQSTNDVVPAAVKLAIYAESGRLIEALDRLSGALKTKANEFSDILRTGRTCLQAAQPMMLGQAFQGYSSVVERAAKKLTNARRNLLTLPLGGTAIGTGLGCSAGYREHIFEHLSEILGVTVSAPDNLFDGMQNADEFGRFSSEVRVAAEVLGKIAADFIILSSAPNSSLAEIVLPAVQAGSSIMPGKINPVMPIMMQQAAFAAIGNDTAVSIACLSGQLEINHFEPVIASRVLDTLCLLTRGSHLFTEKCIAGIQANREQSLKNLMDSSALSTVFVPVLGYEKTSKIVKNSIREGKSFVSVAVEMDLLSSNEINEALRKSTEYQ